MSDPPSSNLFTSDQLNWMKEQLEAQEAKIINRMNTIEHNSSLKRPIDSESTVPPHPLPTTSAPKSTEIPYGMPMGVVGGQAGSSAAVGINAMVVHPTYTTPIVSVPQMDNIDEWIDGNMVELAGFRPPFTTVAYGHGIPLQGTGQPNPLPPYVLMIV